MNYFLDTNVVLIYLRDNIIARQIEADLQILQPNNNLLISVVTLGELKSIAKQNNWGETRLKNLVKVLEDFLITDINTQEIIDKYAEIDAYSQGRLANTPTSFSSKNMGKNDLWIAATASVYDIELLTTDKDFDHLRNSYLPKLHYIDLAKYKP